MVVIDATTLLLMLRPDTPIPDGPDGVKIDRPKERIEYLVQQLDKAKTKIIIPTPALSEALVRAGAAATQQIVEHLQRFAVFAIEPFDTRASIEVAAMTRDAIAGGKKRGTSAATWAKVKYDRQIVAIAKVNGANTIYSDDEDVEKLGRANKINVVSLAALPLPPEKRQLDLELAAPAEPVLPPGEADGQDEDRPEGRS
jgi:predicted nucleic acid-binding protein